MSTILLSPVSAPIISSVSIPGSKSYTNRALFIAALTDNIVTIHNPLFSDDTQAMIKCLETLGITIEKNETSIVVHGGLNNMSKNQYHLDAHVSGTTMRFLLALAGMLPTEITLTGEEGLCKRPIKDLVDAITQLGAKAAYVKEEGFPPVKISGNSNIQTKKISIDGSISSQFISALLMVSPLVHELTIEVTGEQISKPYIDMTIDVMKHFGVTVENNNYKTYAINTNQTYSATEYRVEGDVSSASYFAAIAAVTTSTMTLENISPNSKQADIKFFDILEKMGNIINKNSTSMTIIGKGIQPLDVDMTDCPDQVQTLAVLASFAKGQTIIKGVKSLRVKETERVKAVQQELEKMGIKTEATENTLTIFGGNPHGAIIDTYGDHRMAMAFSVAGCQLDGMKINNPEVVSKTFPTFFDELQKIGIGVKKI